MPDSSACSRGRESGRERVSRRSEKRNGEEVWREIRERSRIE
jgi:hypothetical protein